MAESSDIPLIDPPVQVFTLADGRRLTWQEYGVPDGRPVLYFHGGGSFGREAGIFHREAVRNKIRLISTNRPGVGGSSLRPGRPAAAYSDDLRELLDSLGIDRFSCLGESNGGMMTLVVASAMAARVVGAVPINPTIPWFDPAARRVTSKGAGIGYRLMKRAPRVLVGVTRIAVRRFHTPKPAAQRAAGEFRPEDLVGPPPGTEPDVAAIHWEIMTHFSREGLLAELKWASGNWDADIYAIPVPLDFYCGAHDAQAPFALMLADRNPDARFHYFRYGHHGFSHPDARRRIFATIAGYFERPTRG